MLILVSSHLATRRARSRVLGSSEHWLLLRHCAQIPENNLKGGMAILAHGFRGSSPSWQGRQSRAEQRCSHRGGQEAEKGIGRGHSGSSTQGHIPSDPLRPARPHLLLSPPPSNATISRIHQGIDSFFRSESPGAKGLWKHRHRL